MVVLDAPRAATLDTPNRPPDRNPKGEARPAHRPPRPPRHHHRRTPKRCELRRDRRAVPRLRLPLPTADGHLARSVFNAIVHQYLIPGVQVGSKVEIEPGGHIHGIYSIVRPVTPDAGCLWCNGLISAARVNDESLPDAIRETQRYVPTDDAAAPSIGTLNLLGVAQATNHFMLAVTGLLRDSAATYDYRRFEALSERQLTEIPRKDPACLECGLTTRSVRARGDSAPVPTR